MMNIQWKIEKELTHHNARRYGGQWESSGMRPAERKKVYARNRVGYNCYRATFPTGMKNLQNKEQ